MLSNMDDMSKILEGIEENSKNLEDDLASKTFTVKSGGGMVEVMMNGKGEVVDLTIDDSLMDDKDSLQILLIGALNDVNRMVQDNQKMSAVRMLGQMGGINPFGGAS